MHNATRALACIHVQTASGCNESAYADTIAQAVRVARGIPAKDTVES